MYMKKVIISAVFMSLWIGLFGQLTVESKISKNVLMSDLGTGDPNLDPGLQDLFFSISPNGIPQYGRKVEWNLWQGTNDEVRYYRVKKGRWGKAAISDVIEPVQYNEGIAVDPALTPSIDMERNWVKLSKSWNFSAESYNIVVLSVKNQGNEIMRKARVNFDYPTVDMQVSEVKIYNEWALIEEKITKPKEERYKLVFEDLLPGELRHIYFYIDVSGKTSRGLQDGVLYANLLGQERVPLKKDKTNPPHDPNGLTLINAILNTPPIENCEPFEGHPVLADVCASGVPFWYDNQGYDLSENCKYFNGSYCDLPYSLNYPYCNDDQERLFYQMTCLNDGQGAAGKVIMRTAFADPTLLESQSFATNESSHPVFPTWANPTATFLFEEINLPGLNDPEVVYMYDECSAQVIFSVDTRCHIEEDIFVEGLIEFYDVVGALADELATNSVTAVPEQGQYDNIRPKCTSCIEQRVKSSAEINAEQYILSMVDGDDYITISRLTTGTIDLMDAKTNISLLDISGRVLNHLSVSATQLDAGYRIDVSNLPSGVYVLSGWNGESRFAKKFVR